MRRWRTALTLVLVTSCAQDRGAGIAMEVEFDVFSGRPNPRWSLAADETAELWALLATLPPAPATTQDLGLGYRGFLLSAPEGKDGLPARIRVANGIVTLERASDTESYRDTRGIERRLFQQASQHGFEALVEALSPKP